MDNRNNAVISKLIAVIASLNTIPDIINDLDRLGVDYNNLNLSDDARRLQRMLEYMASCINRDNQSGSFVCSKSDIMGGY